MRYHRGGRYYIDAVLTAYYVNDMKVDLPFTININEEVHPMDEAPNARHGTKKDRKGVHVEGGNQEFLTQMFTINME